MFQVKYKRFQVIKGKMMTGVTQQLILIGVISGGCEKLHLKIKLIFCHVIQAIKAVFHIIQVTKAAFHVMQVDIRVIKVVFPVIQAIKAVFHVTQLAGIVRGGADR